MYLRLKDKVEIMNRCNSDSAVILFEYYLSKAGIEDFEFTDKKAAHALEWSIRKVQEVRKKLIKAGYFLQKKGTYHDGRKIVTTYLGREKTEEFLTLEHYEKVKEV